MVSLASRPFLNTALEKDRGSLGLTDLHYLYFHEPGTPRPEIYEIIAPEQEGDTPRDESFAMSVSVENILRELDISGIKIMSPFSVRNYLYRYSDMVELLKYVVDLVNARFNFDDIQLSLEIYQDQETKYENLTLYIRQCTYNKNIMKIIKEIRREYWQMFPEITGRFLLTTDFRSPR